MDKITAMSNGEKLIAGGGILLLVAAFLPWYSIDFGFGSISRNGLQSPGAIWSLLAVVIGVIMAAAILAPKFTDVKLPDLGSITWPQAHLGLGVGALLLVVIKFLSESSFLGFGFYLGFIAAVALATGGYLYFTENGGKLSKN